MTFYHNYNLIIVTCISIAITQLIKVINHLIVYKKINFMRFVETGGMPSSHSSSSSTLATLVAMRSGISSVSFAIILFFALFIMYEAAGVRRAAGDQAKILNDIVDNLVYTHKPITDKKLKELIGHTPTEVIMGCILGIIIACAFYR